MISFGTNLAIALYLIGIVTFIFNGGHNLLMMVISLELILLSVCLFLVKLDLVVFIMAYIPRCIPLTIVVGFLKENDTRSIQSIHFLSRL